MQLKKLETILLSLLAFLAYASVVEGRHRRQAEQAAATSDNSQTECACNEYRCNGHSICIPELSRCDRNRDCPEGDDEWYCIFAKRSETGCNSNAYKCKDSDKCIPKSKLCNGLFDCPEEDDERNCTNAH